ncbi:MAG: hypothetical protein HQ521_13480 [Bacteroidetes bacterium]|nr:hypothetical protein [Bacteroidota bacterium]
MEEKKDVARLQNLIEKFKAKFPPAADEASSDHLLTTNAIIGIITQHDPWCKFEENDLVSLLENAGYCCEVIEEEEEIGFKWLVSSL